MIRMIHWAMFREFLAAVLAFVAMVFALHLCTGCASKPPEPKLPDYCFSEEKFTDQLVGCVYSSHNLAEAKVCRREVHATCGVVEAR